MRNRSKWKVLGGAILLVLSIGVTQAEALAQRQDRTGQQGSQWNKRMRSLAVTLNDLLIDISSDEKFNSGKNESQVLKNAKKLSSLAHGVRANSSGSPDQDISIQIIGDLFSQEATHAYQALSQGHRSYARGILKSLTGYCIACHTRNGTGPSFPSVGTNPRHAALKPLEQADYLASIRQFDRALEDYERIVAESSSQISRSFELERSVRSALAIAVRVKKDPDRALNIVERVLAAQKAPYFLREQGVAWKKSLEQWKRELPRQAQTEEGFYAEALRLIADAKALQKYPADRSADILYLRASAVLHDLLGFTPKGNHFVEGLYLAGLSYEVLEGLHLWNLHELYYLACMQRSPHSPIAQQCYKHYEQSVYAGFTGTGGVFLPSDVQQKLEHYERLSKPDEKEKSKVKLQ